MLASNTLSHHSKPFFEQNGVIAAERIVPRSLLCSRSPVKTGCSSGWFDQTFVENTEALPLLIRLLNVAQLLQERMSWRRLASAAFRIERAIRRPVDIRVSLMSE